VGVKYIVIGGCAVILHGYYRTTHDIDLLVDPSPENIAKIKEVFYKIFQSDDAFRINDSDIMHYTVVRFAPEGTEAAIDLVGRIGDVSYEKASEDIEKMKLEEIEVPLCGLSTLIETKKGVRPKDKEDLLFLLGKKDYLEKQRNE